MELRTRRLSGSLRNEGWRVGGASEQFVANVSESVPVGLFQGGGRAALLDDGFNSACAGRVRVECLSSLPGWSSPDSAGHTPCAV
jgi:hypothetical protein